MAAPSRVGIVAAKHAGRPSGSVPSSERARKPWLALGISQRTYYRRKAAEPRIEPPAMADAHVAAWFATLGPIAQLEHRAFARRCIAAARRL